MNLPDQSPNGTLYESRKKSRILLVSTLALVSEDGRPTVEKELRIGPRL